MIETQNLKELAYKLERNNPGSCSHSLAADSLREAAEEIERLRNIIGEPLQKMRYHEFKADPNDPDDVDDWELFEPKTNCVDCLDVWIIRAPV